jgi:hypothetical protein
MPIWIVPGLFIKEKCSTTAIDDASSAASASRVLTPPKIFADSTARPEHHDQDRDVAA